MNNLIDIQKQIVKLQKQADDIKSRECDATVAEIIVKMQAFGISIKDLQLAMARDKTRNTAKPARAAAKSRKPAMSAPVKFRGPSGETWSGRGLTPRWLSALLSQGRTKEEFAVGS